MQNKLIIGIDADGTCFTHEYPNIGKDIGAVPVLKALVAEGHRLMLWTMRGNKPTDARNTLQEVLDWFATHEIPLWGINENPEQKASGWSNSNKQYAQLYIDDAAMGCPLIYPPEGRPYVDWAGVQNILLKHGILTKPAFAVSTPKKWKIDSVTLLKDIQLYATGFLFPCNSRTRIVVDKSRSKYKEHQLIYQQGAQYGSVGDCCDYLDDEQLIELETQGLVKIVYK